MTQNKATSHKSSLVAKVSPQISKVSSQTLSVDLQLCFALYSASLSMTKVYKPLLTKLKLTYPQYLVLLVLWEKDGITVNRIGEKLFSDSGTLTPLLKRLEKLGLIQRQRAIDDERKVMITLTEQGKLLQAQAVDVHTQVACSTGCTLTELQDLNNQLILLRANLIKNFTKL